MLFNFDIWPVVAFVLLLAAAIAQANRDAEGTPMLSLKRLWAVRWTICVVAGGIIYFADQWAKTVGFETGWPDAIECQIALPDAVSTNDRSPLIFYFNGVRNGQPIVGNVHGYFLAGGMNLQPWGYLPHEIWFRPDGSMVKPADFTVNGKQLTSINEIERRYIVAFPNPDCGGDTIKAIIAKKHGFSVAAPF